MKIHFIGIGGIGMSALARILLDRGYVISGSDLAPNRLTQQLALLGAKIVYEHLPENITDCDRVVISSSIRSNNPELVEARAQKKEIFHRSEQLGELMAGKKGLLIAGCHGKTGTAALMLWTLRELNPAFAIGGIVKGLETNGGEGSGEYFVAEADESDGSFLTLPAHALILTSADIDHLDYWKTSLNLLNAYAAFARKVPKHRVFIPQSDSFLRPLGMASQVHRVEQHEGFLSFDFTYSGKTFSSVHLQGIGAHLASNAALVFTLALSLGISEEKIRAAFQSFPGVYRRGDFRGQWGTVPIFDDFAHRPKAMEALFLAFRTAYPTKRLVTLFQPLRYSRLRDFFLEFTQALEYVDQAFITDVYGAGETPIPHMSGEALAREVPNSLYLPYLHAVDELKVRLQPGDLLLCTGAHPLSQIAAELVQ